MKSSFKAGYSPSNRWAFDHHIAKKPSVLSEIIARPHLIVAAIGTIALVGMSGTAIWMALPDAPAQQAMVKTKDVAPIRAVADKPIAAATPATVRPAPEKPAAAAVVQQTTAAPAPAKPVIENSSTTTQNTVLAANTNKSRFAEIAGKPLEIADSPASAGPDSLESAYAEDSSAQDRASTAAIPNFRPDAGAQGDEGVATTKPDQTASAASTQSGRIIRAVTMRSKPNARGGVLGTVPAKTKVEVVSCSKWCEIVYKGKRGFIYRSFMAKADR